MKKIVFLVFNVLISYSALSQQLILKDFIHLPNNTDARVNSINDINGNACAIIIIKHNLEDFEIDAGIGYEKIIHKIGETWVWVSPKEYKLVIRKKSYIPFAIDLINKLESFNTYSLTVIDEYGVLSVKSIGAEIWLDNKLLAKNYAKLVLKEGRYSVKVTNDNLTWNEEFVSVRAGDSTFVELIPDKVTISSDLTDTINSAGLSNLKVYAIGAAIYLDDILIAIDSVSLTLKPDKYLISVTKDLYVPKHELLILKAGESKEITFSLKLEEDVETYIKYLNNLSNFSFIGCGYGISYGGNGSIGIRYGYAFGNKIRSSVNLSLGVYKSIITYNIGYRYYYSDEWALILNYGVNGYIYNTVTNEFLYNQKGFSLLVGYDYYLRPNFGLSVASGIFLDTNYDHSFDFAGEVGIVYRFLKFK